MNLYLVETQYRQLSPFPPGTCVETKKKKVYEQPLFKFLHQGPVSGGFGGLDVPFHLNQNRRKPVVSDAEFFPCLLGVEFLGVINLASFHKSE